MKIKKIFRFINMLNTKKPSIIFGILASLTSGTCFGVYNITHGIPLAIPVNTIVPKKTHPNPTGSTSANANTALFGAIISGARGSTDCISAIDEYKLGWSSDKKVYGFVLAKDVILGFTGTGRNSPLLGNDTTTTGEWSTDAFTGKTIYSGKATECGYNILGGYTYSRVMIKDSGSIELNGNFIAYAGPKAAFGSYHPRIRVIGMLSADETIFNDEIRIGESRSCTISTDNTITFPPVDVNDIQDGQALTNKIGDFSVQCDDDSDTPVTVEIQGPKGRYTDAMALTMKDGSDAPAEVRGFIGKDIPLTGQCNGRLDGYSGIVYFVPNAGLEKIMLTPGANKYNWVLCSNGQNKTGQATGSAKLILNWD